ncbi:MAG: hypothetical protein LBC81_01275 [Tannerellaceae bacterium]|jgi:hypothetical protein|nr:hypothetical protein [Tannerellaceae bacterium]
MDKIMKSTVLLLCFITFFSGCNEYLPDGGGTTSMGLETHHLILKNDATPSEVRIKDNGAWIGGIMMDDSAIIENNTHIIVDQLGNHFTRYRDTMVAKWVELYMLDNRHILKVKPQPNTTGVERSFEVLFSSPYPNTVNDAYLRITQKP